MLIWLAQGTAVVGVLMFVLWLLHFPIRNAAILDVGRALSIVLLTIVYAAHAEGYWRRTLILTAMVVIWGLRLAFYLLFNRVHNKPEDGRYAELRRKWGPRAGVKFLLLFEAQAVLCAVLSIPFLVAMHDPAHGSADVEDFGAGLWLIAFLGEVIADIQLARFKRNQTGVCNTGLWRYSRHPNYFFEWLIWISFAIVAYPAHFGDLAPISPAIILITLLWITGIPPAEAQSLRTNVEKYRKYQQSTSRFIPWFPNYK
jgi:steroid 5-alpha reductase family enzyme